MFSEAPNLVGNSFQKEIGQRYPKTANLQNDPNESGLLELQAKPPEKKILNAQFPKSIIKDKELNDPNDPNDPNGGDDPNQKPV